jgi:ubiquitin carboxyl-terminal hydrolase 36/42
MCEMIRHMKRAVASPRGVVTPKPIVLNLRSIAKHFKPGRQEDAHEFMRYLVDGIHEVLLKGYGGLDIHSKRTTAVCVALQLWQC